MTALLAGVAAFLFGRRTGQPSPAPAHAEESAPLVLRGFALEDPPAPSKPHKGRPPGMRSLAPIAIVLAVGFAGYLGWHELRRERQRDQFAAAVVNGDPSHAPDLMRRFGCAGCHQIRGIAGPGGRVGPPLTDVGQRVFLAGMLDNTPDNLVRWIVNPKGVNAQTAMPVTGISEREARDVAAYLLAP
jgi:mono/diheme cytochrome c family protein